MTYFEEKFVEDIAPGELIKPPGGGRHTVLVLWAIVRDMKIMLGILDRDKVIRVFQSPKRKLIVLTFKT